VLGRYREGKRSGVERRNLWRATLRESPRGVGMCLIQSKSGWTGMVRAYWTSLWSAAISGLSGRLRILVFVRLHCTAAYMIKTHLLYAVRWRHTRVGAVKGQLTKTELRPSAPLTYTSIPTHHSYASIAVYIRESALIPLAR
jgi:hypothetical protein